MIAVSSLDSPIGVLTLARGPEGLLRLALAGETGPREFPEFVIDFRQHLAGGAGAAVRAPVRRHGEREL